jgi:hypothetical protein
MPIAHVKKKNVCKLTFSRPFFPFHRHHHHIYHHEGNSHLQLELPMAEPQSSCLCDLFFNFIFVMRVIQAIQKSKSVFEKYIYQMLFPIFVYF